jgi:hypothetical protein
MPVGEEAKERLGRQALFDLDTQISIRQRPWNAYIRQDRSVLIDNDLCHGIQNSLNFPERQSIRPRADATQDDLDRSRIGHLRPFRSPID